MSFLPRNRLFALTSLPLALGLAGCFDVDMTINGEEGVPLSELDIVGASPVELVLAGSDNVILTHGDTLSIDVEGSDEAVAALRFVLDEKTLGIMREGDMWDGSDAATIRITMPAPSEIVITGSGNIEAQDLAENADISILGSGDFTGGDAEVNSLEVNIGGSGSAKFGTLTAQSLEVTLGGSGSAERLEVNLGGSGGADLSGFKADDAEISIAGSGSVSLQSDGEVEANILGSGSVSVKGDAKCTENAAGSGSLTCSS
ncbi:hypothetical protein EH31_12575 [Erythrobacter longus]|uniref:Putative auto-transporter adhesin head GIN domain-containing protein n=1 Tax=Erythrobacter longus TaxID=1044 RepID=A0A074M7T5_ERYLO|nr:head GIN domain-containing protein [Erythrobacter longus]KEO89474.1 hypothetical protein EH31_12575 [Erythrobacter longus]